MKYQSNISVFSSSHHYLANTNKNFSYFDALNTDSVTK